MVVCGVYPSMNSMEEKEIPVTETFPRTAVIMSGITFSKLMRLNGNTIDELKMLYNANLCIRF